MKLVKVASNFVYTRYVHTYVWVGLVSCPKDEIFVVSCRGNYFKFICDLYSIEIACFLCRCVKHVDYDGCIMFVWMIDARQCDLGNFIILIHMRD